MKIMVTGGNGFIGAHVIKELVSRGIEVLSFDIIPPKQCINGVEYTTGTIMDPFTMSRRLSGCDAVFHLAAILGVKRSDIDLLRCMTINIQGTINVLEACVMSGVRNILITSSSEIFGDINNRKIAEDAPFNPKSGYAISKLAAEQFTEAFRREYDVCYRIVRLFNIYGPRQVAEFVLPRFIKMVQQGIPPQIYGDGNQIRSFCHIADASRAIVDVFLNKNTANQTFNIGNDTEPVTIRELAERIIRQLNSSLKPVYVPFDQSDRKSSREIYYRVPDISRIKRMINFKPTVTLDEGIKSVIDNGDIPESWIEPIMVNNQ